ncbi:MAG: cytidine deaminase [Spirochaetaceae bacterium]|nr:MAG: cytidine deaminase [Spirochaetaceae bacterium]
MNNEEMIRRELLQSARKARENAYAPYSGFRVGAAIRLAGSGEIIAGCNVENVSYGATICAERTAILRAIARAGPDRVRGSVEDLVVVTDADPPAVPCALCLQVLQEFCTPHLRIHLADLERIHRTLTLGELLPYPFSSFKG